MILGAALFHNRACFFLTVINTILETTEHVAYELFMEGQISTVSIGVFCMYLLS